MRGLELAYWLILASLACGCRQSGHAEKPGVISRSMPSSEQAAEVEKEIKAWFAGPQESNTYGTWRRRGDSLRALVPVLLKSSDNNVVHEALLMARDEFSVPEVVPDVIRALEELLTTPADPEAGTRMVACDVLGKARNPKAIAVLLQALEDPYLQIVRTPVPGDHGVEMSWNAVWRDADAALRRITGANPVEPPGGRNPGDRDKTRKAWLAWWEREGKTKYGGGEK